MLHSCQALGAARTGPSQVRSRVDGRRGRCPCTGLGVPSAHLVGIDFLPPRAGSRLAGLALALQRRRRRRRAASNAVRRGGRRACIDGAFGRTTHEWCSARAVRLDPCSSSDVLTGAPSQSRGGRKFRPVRSRSPVLHTQCPGHCRVQSVALRPSRAARGANPEAALASRVPPAPSGEGAVRERRLGFSDAADAAGTGGLPPYLPRNTLLANDGRARLGPGRAPPGAGGLVRSRRRRGMLPG
jgi:hypothetical protein